MRPLTISSHTERPRKSKSRLERAEALVVCDREVMGGEPRIKGTRASVYLIGARANAQAVDETHSAYPFLTKEQQIKLAALNVTEHRTRKPRRIRLSKPYYTKRGVSKSFGFSEDDSLIRPSQFALLVDENLSPDWSPLRVGVAFPPFMSMRSDYGLIQTRASPATPSKTAWSW
ncbi:MAG TPA: DUF433 domain-containing protein [Hyphomicrobiaceae bacterium]|nr:DUF433 domain-containing protein [Hyphomicrobiaceae bacterium]